MINETKKNIEVYKAMLPGLKERVAAVALMLFMSIVMMTSASYAWLTISRAPEVQGMNTTITGNGNLEIALVGSVWDEEAKKYVIAQIGESAIGDSSATEGKNIMDANITWGNLINLSDAGYGLSNISLRPAMLSSYNLMKEPLFGVEYSEDGRIEGYSGRYGVGSWTDPGNGKYYFAAGSAMKYGVRAIGVVKGSNASANAAADAMMKEAEAAYEETLELYRALVHGETMVDEEAGISCMDALAMLIEIYAEEKVENTKTDGVAYYHDYSSVVTYTYRLLEEFKKILDAERNMYYLLAKTQAYKQGTLDDNFPTAAAMTAANLKKYNVTLESFGTHVTSYNSIVATLNDQGVTGTINVEQDGVPDHAGLKTLAELHAPSGKDENGNPLPDTTPDPVYWTSINPHLTRLVNIGSTAINGLKMSDMNTNNVSEVSKLLSAKEFVVVINGGGLKDFEQRIGSIMADDALAGNPVTVSVHINQQGVINVDKKIEDAQITTAAVGPFLSKRDMDRIANIETGDVGDTKDWSITDTYGLALDFWVRTNGDDVNLILEGKVIYDTVDATTTDKNGNETILYTILYEEETWNAYQLEGSWYSAASHSLLGTNSQLTQQGCTFEKQTKEVVVGFRGENRVWEDWETMLQQGLISEDSTTQGAGSCYVFYADNETDQKRILKLLEALVIAFVDEEGSELAKAVLDTDNAYTINGKVTVPLKLATGKLYEDELGNQQYAITALTKNQPTWISAIVYLDGTRLTNKEVLSVGEIEGSLNLQFGSNVDLNGAKDDEKLGAIYRSFKATAVAQGQPLGFESSSETITFDYDGFAKQATVTLMVDGEQPGNITGFFTRRISQTQGSRTEAVAFVKQEDGTWKATFEISKPGRYSFRNIQADGVEYTLKDCPTFEITGMSINHVGIENLPSGVSMTSDYYRDVDVKIGIDVDPELMPKNVRAQFRSVGSDGKEFDAILSYRNGMWEGTARITDSGTYELKYVILDGEHWDLFPEVQHVVYLGVKAVVTTTHAVEFPFEGVTENVKLSMKLLDENDQELQNWSNVTLYYANAGSDASDDGIDMEAEWIPSGTGGTYEATMPIDTAGIFQFAKVEIDHNTSVSTIYTAMEAPMFTAIPKAPPQYDSFTPAPYQFAPEKNASMTVAMYYAQAADVWALMVKADGSKQLVKCLSTKIRYDGDATIDPDGMNYYNFTFDMPGDGDWSITKLCFQKVYVNDITYGATAEAPTADNYAASCYIIDVAAENIKSYVVETVKVQTAVNGNAYNNKPIVFGKDVAGNVTGAFMASHEVKNVVFTITDQFDKAIPLDAQNTIINMLSALQCKIHYEGYSLEHGGYTTASVLEDIPISLTTDGNRIRYSIDNTKMLQRAGKYTMTLTYEFAGKTYILSTITYEVWSVAPTVKITAAEFANKSGGNSTFTDTATTVYYKEGTEKSCGITYYNYTPGKVTIALTGYGNASEAKLEFITSNSDGKVHLYEESQKDDGTSTNAYTWTGDGSCIRYIGWWESKTGNDEKIPAGTLTATKIVMMYNNVKYEFDITDIIIQNPS